MIINNHCVTLTLYYMNINNHYIIKSVKSPAILQIDSDNVFFS